MRERKSGKLLGPVYMTDDYKHHYTAIQEHLETLKTLKGPVYAVESKNHYLEIIKHAERLKDLKGPIYECGEIGHKYGGSSNFTPEATDLKTLTGPIFKIDHANQFSEIISCAHELKELHGPIYQADGDTKHQFREMTRLVESLVPMAKPVMVEEGKHSYGEQTMAGYGAEGVKTVHGPIYVKEFSKHNYQEKPKEDHLNTVQLKGKHTLFLLQVKFRKVCLLSRFMTLHQRLGCLLHCSKTFLIFRDIDTIFSLINATNMIWVY